MRARRPVVLAVFAHPDDESLACGGTLARLADLGYSVVLLCVSRGERGGAVESVPASAGDLVEIRKRELDAASQVLGLQAVHRLSYPDGNLRWAGGYQLRDDIVRVIRQHRADAVITFDDDGLYWHADHVAVHEQTSSAVGALGVEAPALYYVTMAPGAMQLVVERASEKRWVRPSSGVWSIDPKAFGVATNAPSFALDVRPWVARKVAALQCHQSQFGAVSPFSLLEASEASAWLGFEYFRRAPLAGRRERMLEGMAAQQSRPLPLV